MRLSYSKLSDYTTCPRKFWFSYIKGVPLQSNKYLVAGKEIHEILYNSTLHADWHRYLMTHPKYEEYKVMIDNYVCYQDNVIKAGGNPVPELAEMKYHDPEDDFSMVIDRIDSFKGRKLLCDYKSDAKPDNDKHDKQLLIYAYFYNKRFPKSPITHYAPLFIKARKTISVKEVTPEKLQEAYNWMLENKKKIEAGGKDPNNFPAMPNSMCEWCSHKMTNHCSEWKKFINMQTIEMVDDETNTKEIL